MFIVLEIQKNPYKEIVIRNNSILTRGSPNDFLKPLPDEEIIELLIKYNKTITSYIEKFAVLYFIKNKIEEVKQQGLLDITHEYPDFKDLYERLSELLKLFELWLLK